MADFTRQHQLSLSRDTTTVCLPHQENCARPAHLPPPGDLTSTLYLGANSSRIPLPLHNDTQYNKFSPQNRSIN